VPEAATAGGPVPATGQCRRDAAQNCDAICLNLADNRQHATCLRPGVPLSRTQRQARNRGAVALCRLTGAPATGKRRGLQRRSPCHAEHLYFGRPTLTESTEHYDDDEVCLALIARRPPDALHGTRLATCLGDAIVEAASEADPDDPEFVAEYADECGRATSRIMRAIVTLLEAERRPSRRNP
jgi:hypothetical protein